MSHETILVRLIIYDTPNATRVTYYSRKSGGLHVDNVCLQIFEQTVFNIRAADTRFAATSTETLHHLKVLSVLICTLD